MNLHEYVLCLTYSLAYVFVRVCILCDQTIHGAQKNNGAGQEKRLDLQRSSSSTWQIATWFDFAVLSPRILSWNHHAASECFIIFLSHVLCTLSIFIIFILYLNTHISYVLSTFWKFVVCSWRCHLIWTTFTVALQGSPRSPDRRPNRTVTGLVHVIHALARRGKPDMDGIHVSTWRIPKHHEMNLFITSFPKHRYLDDDDDDDDPPGGKPSFPIATASSPVGPLEAPRGVGEVEIVGFQSRRNLRLQPAMGGNSLFRVLATGSPMHEVQGTLKREWKQGVPCLIEFALRIYMLVHAQHVEIKLRQGTQGTLVVFLLMSASPRFYDRAFRSKVWVNQSHNLTTYQWKHWCQDV